MTDVDRTCRMRIEPGGHPGRTPLVLERERNLWEIFAGGLGAAPQGDMTTVVTSEPIDGADEPVVTVDHLEAVLAPLAGDQLQAGAFVAGRCEPADPTDAGRIDELLVAFDALDRPDLGSTAIPFVEAAMSLVLRGQEDVGRRRLEARFASGARTSMADWLAAFYLAELGDVRGYPALVRMLGEDGFTRLMAARHLVGFLPYDGQDVDGQRIDVRGRLEAMLDDPDPLVAREVPALLDELTAAGG